MPNESTQETLNRILEGLKSGDSASQLAAIYELENINYSSQAIILQLERLALNEKGAVQKLALAALNLTTNQFVASQLSKIAKPSRELILSEIRQWQESGLIDEQLTTVLGGRYDFDIRLGTPIKARVAVTQPDVEKSESIEAATPVTSRISEAQSVPEQVEQTAQMPRPSLTHVVLSETSIRIYLYLSAFFVIASAAILAALVQAARLALAYYFAGFLLRKKIHGLV